MNNPAKTSQKKIDKIDSNGTLKIVLFSYCRQPYIYKSISLLRAIIQATDY